jgi:hypothetical protein
MANVIIRVELLGRPSAEIYERLHGYMAHSNWSRTIDIDNGQTINLPHAMYCGSTENAFADVAQALKDEIVRGIWSQGATVLIIAWNAWGMSQ